MSTSVFDKLQEKLQHAAVPFTVTRHQPVFPSEEAAAVRGTTLASGAKALVVKAGEGFVLLVLPADRIEAGPRPLEEAVAISKQFIEGLQSTR